MATQNAIDNKVTDANFEVLSGNIELPATDSTGSEGVVTVAGTRWISNYGTSNVFMGNNAGNTTLTVVDAVYNIGIGTNALTAATSASRNVAVGFGALSSATTGDRNVAIGMNAATNLTTGNRSTFIGPYVASTITTGAHNIIIGNVAGQSLDAAASSNIIIGSFGVSGDDNTIRIGNQGTGDGYQNKAFMAGIYNTATTTGTEQVVFIDSDGQIGASTITENGVAIGSSSGAITATAAATTGQTLMGNTGAAPSFTGSPAFSGSVTAGTGLTVTTGNAAVSAGNITLPSTNSTGSQGVITVAGSRWISNYGTSNVFMGKNSGNYSLTGHSNVGIGGNALSALTSGYQNAAICLDALKSVTSGARNFVIGTLAGDAITTGNQNIVMGHDALAIGTAVHRNISIGGASLQALTTGTDNICLAFESGKQYTGSESHNICIASEGVTGDLHTIRIGEQGTGTGQQNKAFMAGIYNTTQAGGVDQVVTIDSNGQLGADDELVMANQPAFLAYLGTSVTNATGNGTYWRLGTTTALTEVFDQGSDFNTNGTFTAPVTGKYMFSATVKLSSISATTLAKIRLTTSNRTYDCDTINASAVKDYYNQLNLSMNMLVDMDAGDTAVCYVFANGEGADTVGIVGASFPVVSYFSGYLAC